MCISPLILSQWCTNPASDVKTASLECLFLDLLKSLAWYQQSLCTFGCVLRAVILNMITRFYAWLLYQKQTWWEPTAYLGIGKEKYTSPSLFQRCLALSQSAESTAWSCLENLIRSHSAEHIEFQEAGKLLPLEGVWKMVHVGGGRTKITLRWLRNILTQIMFDLPSRALSSGCLGECLHGELKSVQGLFWIDSAPRVDVSRLGVGGATETFHLVRRPFWWIWEAQAWRNKGKKIIRLKELFRCSFVLVSKYALNRYWLHKGMFILTY